MWFLYNNCIIFNKLKKKKTRESAEHTKAAVPQKRESCVRPSMEKPGGSGGFSWLLEIPPWGGVPLHSRPSFPGFENEDSLLLSHC